MSKKHIISLMITISGVCFFAEKIYAQQRPVYADSHRISLGVTQTRGYSQNIFKEVKAHIADMLLDNRKLETQYETLEKEFVTLKDQFDQRTYGIGAMDLEVKKTSNLYHNQKKQLQMFNEDIQEFQGERLLLKSQISFLRGEVIDLDETLRMKKLKLSDLQFEKRERAMDLKLDRFSRNEKSLTKKKTREDLEKQLKINKLQQKKLQSKIEEMKGDYASPYKIERFKQEISDLEYKIKDKQKQIDFKFREMANMKNKKLFSVRSFDLGIRQKQKERDEFEQIVAELQGEYDAIATKVTGSLDKKQKNQALITQLITLDQENQQLRDLIVGLREKMEISHE